MLDMLHVVNAQLLQILRMEFYEPRSVNACRLKVLSVRQL
jgi:hypothetical protein